MACAARVLRRSSGTPLCRQFGGTVDGASDAWIGSAAADVAGHGFVNIGIGWFGILFQQNRGAHDLAGLAIAALRNIDFDPGALYGVGVVGRESLNGGNGFPLNTRERCHTRTNGVAIEMDGAGSAKSHTATKLGASKT